MISLLLAFVLRKHFHSTSDGEGEINKLNLMTLATIIKAAAVFDNDIIIAFANLLCYHKFV